MKRVNSFSFVLLFFLETFVAAAAQQDTAAFRLAVPPIPMRLAIGPVDGGSATGKSDEQIFRRNYKLAQSGNTDAAFEVGLEYAEGVGVAHDAALAEQWLERGAVKADDKRILAELYVGGWYFDQNPAKAAYWFRAAGEPGDLFELAEMYRKAEPSQTALATPIYLELLQMKGHPEVRRAQMELGNLVLDGKYRQGEDAASRTLELSWARSIAQELLGQVEYNIALDYKFGREGIPANGLMWTKFCMRAAAYNVDLAQQSLAEGMLQGTVPGGSMPESYAWLRLASEKQTALKKEVAAWEALMDDSARRSAEQAYADLAHARDNDGAYYRANDPLREAADGGGEAEDDPDRAMRKAFELEKETLRRTFSRP